LETSKEVDDWSNGQEYLAYHLTETGEHWIMENQEKLEFKIPEQTNDGNNV